MPGHIRTPKNFVLEERLARYEGMLEVNPAAYRGTWARACAPFGPDGSQRPFSSVHLDLGCGKGSYLVEAARRNPSELFIGLDEEPICIAYAGQRVAQSGARNAVVVPAGADALGRIFAPGELTAITVNFPTPHPKARHEKLRLTHIDRLLAYRELLAPEGKLTLRTDSMPFFKFSLAELSAAGWRTVWESADTRADHPELPCTEYEERLVGRGAVVYGVCAVPGPAPKRIERTAQASLAAYLPQNLDELDYVPLGMERAVENFSNYRTKQWMKALGR